jgi:outer membrane protein
MKKFQYLIVFLFVAFATQMSFGQKFGHVNSGNLMVLLPEVAQADSSLALYRDSLFQVGQAKAQDLEKKVKEFLAKRSAGEMTPKQEQEEGSKLQQEEQALGAYEQEIRARVQAKREQLLSPILERVNDAIQAVGKENNYTMIFDTSIPNTVLFVEETDNVLPLVATKLGIEIKE